MWCYCLGRSGCCTAKAQRERVFLETKTLFLIHNVVPLAEAIKLLKVKIYKFASQNYDILFS